MSKKSLNKAMLLKKDLELIKQEEAEFIQRLIKELATLVQEGIGFYLPIVVIDHISDTVTNLSFIKSRVKSCAKEGVEEGDGLNLFKIRRVLVRTEVKGRKVIRPEVMKIAQCQLVTAHQAIYRMLNQTAATRLRIGVYVFDHDGCQYPDRTMCYEPIDSRLFANDSSVNKLILDPVFIDVKEDRARAEERQQVSKIEGGYPVARLVGTTDILSYRELTQAPSTHRPSTHDKPPGSSFVERSRTTSQENCGQQLMPKSSKPSTHDKSSDLSFGERSVHQNRILPAAHVQPTKDRTASVLQPAHVNSQINCRSTQNNQPMTQARDYRSVLFTEPIRPPKDNRIVVREDVHLNKLSISNRLGSTNPVPPEDARETLKRGNIEPHQSSKRLSVDTSVSLSLSSATHKKSSIQIKYTPLREELLREVTNNQKYNQQINYIAL